MSTPADHHLQPITLDTIAAIHGCRHRLSAYCASCSRWKDLDLERLIREGLGRRKLVDVRPRCRACGARGTIQLHPPMPEWTGYHPMSMQREDPN